MIWEWDETKWVGLMELLKEWGGVENRDVMYVCIYAAF
jgi:hypothetical protein